MEGASCWIHTESQPPPSSRQGPRPAWEVAPSPGSSECSGVTHSATAARGLFEFHEDASPRWGLREDRLSCGQLGKSGGSLINPLGLPLGGRSLRQHSSIPAPTDFSGLEWSGPEPRRENDTDLPATPPTSSDTYYMCVLPRFSESIAFSLEKWVNKICPTRSS